MQDNIIFKELKEAQDTLETFLANPENIQDIERAGSLMVHAIKSGSKIISCGNGGSMSDAMHFAEELTGRFRNNRPSLPAIAISDPSYISCVANDYGYNKVFSRFVEGVGNNGDVLLAISTSGNSENIVEAIKVAKSKGMQVIGLTGKDGGKVKPLCNVNVNIAHSGYADRIQEMHIKIIHILILFIEQNISK